jgi:RimJ/RimL family protein N-acetyltransferase
MQRGTWPVDQPSLTDGVVELRAFVAADAAEVCRACQDLELQHFTQVPVPYLLVHAEEWVAGNAPLWAEGRTANFAVVRRSDGRLVGDVGVIGADHRTREAGVGYWTAAWGRGQGLTSRAVRLACDWALEDGGLQRLLAEVEPANPASERVVAAAGFHRCGVPPRTDELKGTLRSWGLWERRAE